MRARRHGAPHRSQIGRLRLLDLLGSGGIGHVWLAERMPERERVAVKVLRAEHADDETLVARLEREALLAQRVSHPNVLAVLDVAVRKEPGSTDPPHFVMELLEGADLADTLAWAGRLAPTRAVRIAIALASALGAAHACGIVHRDVKPENVFLVHARDGREIVKLLDFGHAWSERDESASGARPRPQAIAAGTPEYMAPMLDANAPPSPWLDVYALSVVLFEMLTGRLPFSAPTPHQLARLHREAPVPPVDGVSPELEAVVARGLAKHQKDRFVDMRALRAALEAVPEAAG